MGYGGRQSIRSGDIRRFNFTGNGSNTIFDLGFTPATQNQLIVTVNGLVQHYDAFSISGSTLTFTGTPGSGDAIQVTAVVDAVGVAAIPDGAIANVSTLTVSGAATFSNTVAVTGVLTAAANVNFDSGTFFLDGTNNRIGINNTAPSKALTVTGAVPQVRINEAGGSYWDIEAGGRFDITNSAGTRMLSIAGPGLTPTGSGIQIANSGIVTIPNQPAFFARIESGNFTSTSTVVFNTAYLNRGSHYNTSTGLFTAPIAGVYHFQGRFRSVAGGEMNPVWVKNGTDQQYWGTSTSFIYGSYTVQLAAGDTISIREVNGTNKQGVSDYHNLFAGHLLG